MPLYKFNKDESKIEDITKTCAESNGIKECDIRDMFCNESILNKIIKDENLLVLAKEFGKGDFDDTERRIDLLCINKENNLVVIEFKRAKSVHMELQALRYAAFVSSCTFEDICGIAERNGKPSDEILNHIGKEKDEAPLSFNENTKIILVAEDFSKELTATVLWLGNRYEIDISCVRIHYYNYKGDIILDIDKIIPLPETEDYIIKMRKKETEIKSSSRDRTKYRIDSDLQCYGKGRLVYEIVRRFVDKDDNITFEELEHNFPGKLQQTYGVVKIATDIDETKNSRYFPEIITIGNGEGIRVCKEWGIGNINPFIRHAEQLGFKITKQ